MGRDLGLTIQLLTLELKFDLFIAALERRYSPEQPRVPAGDPAGGQWTGGGGGMQRRSPIQTALAGVLITQRVGVGEAGMIRQCIYQDIFERQYGIEQEATELCPPTYVAKPYYGPY